MNPQKLIKLWNEDKRKLLTEVKFVLENELKFEQKNLGEFVLLRIWNCLKKWMRLKNHLKNIKTILLQSNIV